MTRTKRRQYGTGSVYRRASDGKWLGVVDAGFTRSNGRRRVTVVAKSEAEAKRKLRDKINALEAGAEVASRATVKSWSDTWLPLIEKRVRPSSYNADRSAVRAWIVPTIGHKRLADLTPADIRAVDTAVSAKLSTTTALRYRSTLMQLLKDAIAEGHAVPERVLRVKPPAIAVTDRQAMPTVDAVKMLAAAALLPHGSRWAAAFLQGLRPAEARGLTWDSISGDVFTISWQLQSLPYKVKRDRTSGFRVPDGYEYRQVAHGLHLVRPKSKAGLRTYPLLDWMSEALDHWRAIVEASEQPKPPGGLVWPMAANDKADVAEWRRLQDAAGVRHPSGRYYHRHESRHTTATLLLELGVPERVRVAIMGHSSIASTAAYEHVRDPQLHAALAGVAERLQLTPPEPAG